MALPPAFLDELRARTPLASVIGRKVRLAKNGRNWKGCCPFHNEKTPSFYVYDDHYHCFGCGAHGDAIGFTMQTEGLPFREAVERLAAEASLDLPKETPQQAAREARARDLHGVLHAAMEAMQRRLHLPEGRPALDYLRRRGLTDETITRFGLGWSGAGRGTLAADLKPLGIEPAQLAEAGLTKPAEDGSADRDFFFNRVMFPIRDRRGRIVSFGGRILGDGQPKYLNGPETPVFSKRRTLYGLDMAREAVFRGARLVVVEGYMDVIALHQAGFGGAVAPLGTALTEEHLEELWRVSPEPILCLDGDAAGARAAMRSATVGLPLVGTERRLRFATLPAGEDPDTFVAKSGNAAFEALMAGSRGMPDLIYDAAAEGKNLASPEGRAALRNDLVSASAQVKDRSLAAEYRSLLLDRFFASRPRRGAPPASLRPRPARTPPSAIAARLDQARHLLAITIAHPWILGEAEEAFALLTMPPGHAEALQGALLAWHSGNAGPDSSRTLDSDVLLNHLTATGLAEARDWASRGAGLPAAARRDAQPGEALSGWWHFFGLLRGEADLVGDQRAAARTLAETNDPAAEARLRHLTEALLALRQGETEPEGTALSGTA
ncbi:DNA primase [Roseomonas sp. CCTCC AB2023176]|uniref:DNA primase n=1 Tax=Roseomonas sp. CCTCC AB2023176 TaxID=3342640 RepID=UPI0035DB48D6